MLCVVPLTVADMELITATLCLALMGFIAGWIFD